MYQILLYFEKTSKEYISKEFLEMTFVQFQKMSMIMGDILEPIAPLCSTKRLKSQNGMIKVHLQHPEIDGQVLLSSLKIFSLILEGKSKILKVTKHYTSLAQSDLLTITVSNLNLSYLLHYKILTEIVEMGFYREQDCEIMQIHK